MHNLDTLNLIGVAMGITSEVGLAIRCTLDNISGNIEGVTRGFWDSEAVVEGDTSRDSL